MMPDLSKRTWFKGQAMSEIVVATINRESSNRTVCGSYLYRISERSTPLCEERNEEEDLKLALATEEKERKCWILNKSVQRRPFGKRTLSSPIIFMYINLWCSWLVCVTRRDKRGESSRKQKECRVLPPWSCYNYKFTAYVENRFR